MGKILGAQPVGSALPIIGCAVALFFGFCLVTVVPEENGVATGATQETVTAALVDDEHPAALCILVGPTGAGHVRGVGKKVLFRRGREQPGFPRRGRSQARHAGVLAGGVFAGGHEGARLNEGPGPVSETVREGGLAPRAINAVITGVLGDLDVAAPRALAVIARGHEVLRIVPHAAGFPDAPAGDDLRTGSVFADPHAGVSHEQNVLLPGLAKVAGAPAMTVQNFKLDVIDRKRIRRQEPEPGELRDEELLLPALRLPGPEARFPVAFGVCVCFLLTGAVVAPTLAVPCRARRQFRGELGSQLLRRQRQARRNRNRQAHAKVRGLGQTRQAGFPTQPRLSAGVEGRFLVRREALAEEVPQRRRPTPAVLADAGLHQKPAH